ncbi:MAG: BglG family transcription antiterminator, partial [Tetragenococcus koreensis]|nr:BglG family transcription antiterminator [Tetragenococcus koreensis]
ENDYLLLNKSTEDYLQNYLIELQFFDDVYYSKENRQLMVIFLLACSYDYLSLNHLIVMLQTSKSTVLNDLKELKKALNEKNIQVKYSRLNGYQLFGKEENIRSFIMREVINFVHQNNGEKFVRQFIEKYLNVDYERFESVVLLASNKYKITFFENNLKEFSFCFILLSQRFKYEPISINHINNVINCQTGEYRFSKEICEYFQINDSDNIYYITAWVLGLSVGNIEKETLDRPVIKQIVQGIVYRFESLAGIRFLTRKSFVKRLYEHFRPSYYRILYHLPIVNPLALKIKKEYAEMYLLVKEAVLPLQSLFGRELPEDEIAFLTVHFAVATFEEPEEQVKKSKCLVLCPSGIGTSLILLKELEALFPTIEFVAEDFRQVTELVTFDIIFSTTVTPKIVGTSTPFIIVNPIMTTKEKFELISRVYELLYEDLLVDPKLKDFLLTVKKHVSDEQYKKIESDLFYESNSNYSNLIIKERGDYPVLSEVATTDLIQLNVEATNWEDAIRKATKVLITKEKVEPSYIDGMVRIAKETGPYIVITKNVALPHARPEDGAKEIAISIATLKKPIRFGNSENDPVKYIIGLSAVNNQTHLTAMAELAELLEKKEFYSVLDNAKKPEEISKYIKNFESRDWHE